MLTKLDVGIVYSGERKLLRPLVRSLAASAASVPTRLILIDNATPEGVDEFTSDLPTTVVRNVRKLTYAANLNRMVAAAEAPYVLCLNTDMLFDPRANCLAKMVDFMDRNPRCGVGGCRIYHGNGRYAFPARRFPTWRMIAARRLPWCGVFPRSLAAYLYAERGPRENFACDWLSGCFLMLRRAACAEVGSFDERFRKYFEDVDYCRRLATAGWQVMHCGETSVVHFEQRASRRWFSRDALEHLQSYARWLWKWNSPLAKVGHARAH